MPPRCGLPSRFQGSTSQKPAGQPLCLPGQDLDPAPRNCPLLPSSWAVTEQRDGPSLCLWRRDKVWWVHPEAMGAAELVQTVRIHPWAVWGHVGCSSCGPTMDALALGRELFTANVTAVDIRGLVMHPASWEATPSP